MCPDIEPGSSGPDFESVFARIGERLMRTLREVPAPDGTVYACGFWLFYCDYTTLGVPNLAYNILGKEEDVRWYPPDWFVDADERICKALAPLYQEINELMAGQEEDVWVSLMEHQWECYSLLCRSITRDARSLLSHWRLTDDFVCGILDVKETDEVYTYLIESSIGKRKAIRLGILKGR